MSCAISKTSGAKGACISAAWHSMYLPPQKEKLKESQVAYKRTGLCMAYLLGAHAKLEGVARLVRLGGCGCCSAYDGDLGAVSCTSRSCGVSSTENQRALLPLQPPIHGRIVVQCHCRASNSAVQSRRLTHLFQNQALPVKSFIQRVPMVCNNLGGYTLHSVDLIDEGKHCADR